jgi:hypothetical protein
MKKKWLIHQSDIFKDVHHEPIFINIGNYGARAYTWTKEKTMFITFRGMCGINFYDIKAVCDIRHHKSAHGSIQNGYWLYVKSILPDLLNQISSKIDDIDTIHFAGHSLGSSLAAISALELGKILKQDYSISLLCDTFGGPRFCDKSFSDAFMHIIPNSSHTIIKDDPIPKIINGFQHCIQNELILQDMLFSNSNYIIEKHACIKYIKLLKKSIDDGILKEH